MAEHLICNQEVVGSTPTAGSRLAQLGSRRRRREDCGDCDQYTAGSVGCAGTAHQGSPGPACRAAPWKRDTSRMTRERNAPRGPGGRRPLTSVVGARASRTRRANSPPGSRCDASALGPGIEHRGRFQSGQMGQTVNLVVTPSAVRIRLSPPKPLAHEPSRSARVRAKLAIPSSSPSARLECESTRESNPAQRFAACAQLRAGVVQW